MRYENTKTARADQAARRVRCLGPGREHDFVSPDPARVRVCPACRRRQDALGVSPQMVEPLRVGNG